MFNLFSKGLDIEENEKGEKYRIQCRATARRVVKPTPSAPIIPIFPLETRLVPNRLETSRTVSNRLPQLAIFCPSYRPLGLCLYFIPSISTECGGC